MGNTMQLSKPIAWFELSALLHQNLQKALTHVDMRVTEFRVIKN